MTAPPFLSLSLSVYLYIYLSFAGGAGQIRLRPSTYLVLNRNTIRVFDFQEEEEEEEEEEGTRWRESKFELFIREIHPDFNRSIGFGELEGISLCSSRKGFVKIVLLFSFFYQSKFDINWTTMENLKLFLFLINKKCVCVCV